MKKEKEILFKRIDDTINDYQTNIAVNTYKESVDENVSFIYLDLKNTQIYNNFGGNCLLNNEIFEFIDAQLKLVKVNNSVTFVISYPQNMEDVEKDKIEKIIKAHYAINIKILKKDILKTNIIGWVLLAVGILTLVGYGLLNYFNVNFIFMEVIDIFAWVFVWESCSTFAFKNSDNKFEMLKNIKLFNAKITRK